MNLHENFDIDEETRFSSVYRGSALDDSGYEEDEDIMLDSRNDETFGGLSGSVSQRPADLTSGKRNDAAQFSSSTSLVVVPLSIISFSGIRGIMFSWLKLEYLLKIFMYASVKYG